MAGSTGEEQGYDQDASTIDTYDDVQATAGLSIDEATGIQDSEEINCNWPGQAFLPQTNASYESP